MKVLYLTQYYTPEAVFVVPELAQSLQSLGHDVTVLTGFPNYPSGKLYPGYYLKHWQKENVDGIPVIRIPLYPNHSKVALKRALNFISFTATATLLGPLLTPRSDVIYVTYPPVTLGLPAWLLSRFQHVPFVSEIQDMWPENLRSTGYVNNEKILGLIDRFAKWSYRRAAAIRVISPGFRDNLLEKGVPSNKIRVIPNSIDTDFYRPIKPDPVLAQQLGLTDRFNIMYAGTHGSAQDLRSVVEAASLLRDASRIQFVFVGTGTEILSLQELVQSRKLENVKFLGRYSVDVMADLYALADVLLLHLLDDPLYSITIPSKTQAYLASGKPVLAAVNGDAADLVKSASAGLTCPPSNPRELADTVLQFYKMSAADRYTMGQNGRRAACELFSKMKVVGEIAKIMEEVVKYHKAK